MRAAAHQRIKGQLYFHLSRLGKALSSAKRLELLDLLCQCERSVEELAQETGLGLANTSAQLRVLHAARLVESRKQGRRVLYTVAGPEVSGFWRQCQDIGRARLAEIDQIVRLYYEAPDAFEPVSPEELQRRLRADQVLLLDVRPEQEYRAGHIRGARAIPLASLRRRARELPKGREIVAYCRGPFCLFSVEAVQILRQQGRRARRLAMGLPDWRAAGLPTTIGDEP